jgi:hypothetical protein
MLSKRIKIILIKKKIVYTKHCKNYKYQITFYLFIYFKTLKDISN